MRFSLPLGVQNPHYGFSFRGIIGAAWLCVLLELCCCISKGLTVFGGIILELIRIGWGSLRTLELGCVSGSHRGMVVCILLELTKISMVSTVLNTQ